MTNDEYCSKKCVYANFDKRTKASCSWCGQSLIREQSELKKSKSGRSFCNRSCAVSFNNTQKRKSRRSKCEKLLFELLQHHFPSLDIIANDKSTLDGYEADIAIPSLKLAIEWNGIVHFKPIYGQKKLDKIQDHDAAKQLVAEKKGINLIIVPDLVSSDKYVREAFQKIRQIIEQLQLPV